MKAYQSPYIATKCYGLWMSELSALQGVPLTRNRFLQIARLRLNSLPEIHVAGSVSVYTARWNHQILWSLPMFALNWCIVTRRTSLYSLSSWLDWRATRGRVLQVLVLLLLFQNKIRLLQYFESDVILNIEQLKRFIRTCTVTGCSTYRFRLPNTTI